MRKKTQPLFVTLVASVVAWSVLCADPDAWWRDDALVVSHSAEKWYAAVGEQPHVEVSICAVAEMVLSAVNLFVADPPCTPWSTAGKQRGLLDPRDCLLVTCDLIRELKPRAWLIANVPGLDTKPNWLIVQRTIGGLADDYVIDYASLDAADYGVPQHRRRPFWFGRSMRAQFTDFRWPAPTHFDPSTPHMFGGAPWVSCREALGHLSEKDLGRRVKLAWKPAKHHRPSQPSRPGRTITSPDESHSG